MDLNRTARIAGLVISLALAPLRAQAMQYPDLNLRDNGARIGFEFETQPYVYQGINCIKVTGVYPRSPVQGVIGAGDCVYSANGFDLRDSKDLTAIISSGGPGATVALYYFSAANGYENRKSTVTTVSDAVFSQTAQASAPSYCDAHPGTCVAAGVAAIGVAAWLVGKALSSSSSSYSGASSSSSSNASTTYQYRQPRYEPPPPPPPQPDASVGCAWGDRAYGTCH